jgi:hypothetical protein
MPGLKPCKNIWKVFTISRSWKGSCIFSLVSQLLLVLSKFLVGISSLSSYQLHLLSNGSVKFPLLDLSVLSWILIKGAPERNLKDREWAILARLRTRLFRYLLTRPFARSEIASAARDLFRLNIISVSPP